MKFNSIKFLKIIKNKNQQMNYKRIINFNN